MKKPYLNSQYVQLTTAIRYKFLNKFDALSIGSDRKQQKTRRQAKVKQKIRPPKSVDEKQQVLVICVKYTMVRIVPFKFMNELVICPAVSFSI